MHEIWSPGYSPVTRTRLVARSNRIEEQQVRKMDRTTLGQYRGAWNVRQSYSVAGKTARLYSSLLRRAVVWYHWGI